MKTVIIIVIAVVCSVGGFFVNEAINSESIKKSLIA